MVKKFTDYYSNDDFRRKHLEYISEKIECDCGKTVSRCNMSRHLKSQYHIIRMRPDIEQLIDKKLSDLFKNELNRLKQITNE